MDDLTRNATGTTPRRGFFRHIAGAMALGLAGVAPDPARAQGAAARPSGLDWPGPLLPSGVWGVNRAQEAGCTYCAGG